MTATTAPFVKEKELVSYGLVESPSDNLISDFTPSKFKQPINGTEQGKDDFVNTFICHLIFYAFFCVSLFLHIIFDLGLGSFIKKLFYQLTGLRTKLFLKNNML